jgi:hypothetical protein
MINNLVYTRVPDNVIKVFEKYVSKETLSVGVMVRKLPYILMDLCNTVGNDWTAVFEYDKASSKFVTRFCCTNSKIKLTVFNSLKEGVDYNNTLSILEGVFKSDKWISMYVRKSRVELITNGDNEYVYEKAIQEDYQTKNRMWAFHVTRKKKSFFSRLFTKKDNITIKGFRVVSMTLM